MADAAAPWKELSKWIEMDGAIGLFGWTFDVLFLSSRPSILRISSQLLITQAYAGNSLATQNLSPLRPTECSLFCDALQSRSTEDKASGVFEGVSK
jgi:hypothetical protein